MCAADARDACPLVRIPDDVLLEIADRSSVSALRAVNRRFRAILAHFLGIRSGGTLQRSVPGWKVVAGTTFTTEQYVHVLPDGPPTCHILFFFVVSFKSRLLLDSVTVACEGCAGVHFDRLICPSEDVTLDGKLSLRTFLLENLWSPKSLVLRRLQCALA